MVDLAALPPEQLAKFLAVAEKELEKRKKENALGQYAPYAKQVEFHASGKLHRERLFMAGNQLGKTLSGSMEAAMHATGLYTPGWTGRVLEKHNVGWAAGVTGESTRDTVQRLLLGRVGQYGTGAIPKSHLIETIPSRGVPELVDTIRVKHGGGGDIQSPESVIGLKSYEKGREKWQGETLDWVWFDEEPGEDIYSEGLTRTNATGGFVWMTFTPLLGMSRVVERFLLEKSPDRDVISMTIDDVGHYNEAQKAQIIAGYLPHEREARARGIPIMGSGRVFPISEEDIRCAAFEIPKHWACIAGLDFGWDHPTAGVKLAHDRDTDTVYVVAAYRKSQATPLVHAAAIKPWGKGLPWAWPHDGLAHDKGSGRPLAEQYRSEGLGLLTDHAKFPDGTWGVEAGIMMMLERMETGKLKVFDHLTQWFEEFRMYHRKEGIIVKERDDLMSATRYALMSLRFAKAAGSKEAKRYRYKKNAGDGATWMSA